MARRREPNYFRSLINLWPALAAVGGAQIIEMIDGALCSRMPKTVGCTPLLPAWFYILAFAVVIVSCVWTCWAWYKDHVRGDYQMDLVHGTDRYRD